MSSGGHGSISHHTCAACMAWGVLTCAVDCQVQWFALTSRRYLCGVYFVLPDRTSSLHICTPCSLLAHSYVFCGSWAPFRFRSDSGEVVVGHFHVLCALVWYWAIMQLLILGCGMSFTSGLTSGLDHTHPAYVLVMDWAQGKLAAFDITPLKNPCYFG